MKIGKRIRKDYFKIGNSNGMVERGKPHTTNGIDKFIIATKGGSS